MRRSQRCSAATNDAELGRAEAWMRVALDAPRAKFLTQFNLLPGRRQVPGRPARRSARVSASASTALEVLNVELDGLLESWFDPGFLELRRITWQSPALVLEKLIAYEAVHPIESWDDLRNRLDHRPPLLRVLPSAHAQRAADFRRDRAR